MVNCLGMQSNGFIAWAEGMGRTARLTRTMFAMPRMARIPSERIEAEIKKFDLQYQESTQM